MKVPVLALAAAFSAFSATAAEKADTNPDWIRKPTAAQLLVVYPVEAMRRGVSGAAVIECKVSLEGALFECRPISETPAGMGFGAAAVALTPQFLMKPATRGGEPVVTVIRLPINFRSQGAGVPPGGQRLLTQVAWTSAPTYAEAAAAFPIKARDISTPGHVALGCTIKADGGLTNCRTISEQPKGLGFGKAARDLAGRFRAPTTTPDGALTKGAQVHVPVTFAIEMLGAAPRIGKAQWVSLPTGDEMENSLPPAARTTGGRVVLDCRIIAGGHVEDCQVAEETPAAQGFATSALSVSDKFVLSLWTAEGLPTQGGRVRVPVRYTPQ
ncbi:MAG: hypothetical protein B7Y99_04465 [Caulobacterales bacterium 32-69-10]|nr:MAG: hypothetical protein B7Y99_04465 [Caulobacterales bacterium 32-69-10]